MPVFVSPSYRDLMAAHILTELKARKDRDVGGPVFSADICDWSQERFYIPQTEKPIILMPHQIATWRYLFNRRDDHKFPYQTILYSTIKQSGKSTAAGVFARYMGETQTRYGEIFTVGNDLDQAKTRSFREIRYSLEMTPGYNKQRDTLPGRWKLQKLTMDCIMTGSQIRAIAVDAKGEAGGKPALSVWTELWGFEYEDALRFWDELTPVPTIPDSLRMVETYAGYDGESKLLQDLYKKGLEGHQLTAGELAYHSQRPDKPGETFQDLVNGWQEAKGDPDALVPVWSNPATGLAMYWDSGEVARRMPWQKGPEGDAYYRQQEASLPGPAFRRMHGNEWVGAESSFVPLESWDACGHVHDIEPLLDGDRVQLVVAVDAATTGDCFAIIAVSRCPLDPACVDVRAFRLYSPSDFPGGAIQYEFPEAFLRATAQINNVVQITYDAYQLENMMQTLRKDSVAWCEAFSQLGERLKADRQLYDMILSRRVHHGNQPELRQHIANANAKIQREEDSKLRIVKKKSGGKIDLAVALSMGVARCLYLMLTA